MAKYKDVSETVGYGLKTAKIPSMVVMMNNGCFRRRMQRPPTYPPRCSQKIPRKNSLKESNISMKKYHHRPILGVKSGSSNCTPYVDARNSHEPPIRRLDMYSSQPTPAVKIPNFWPANFHNERGRLSSSITLSKDRSMSGGRRRAGYIEKYEAKPNASTELMGLLRIALAIAKRMAQLVKALVDRLTHVAMVMGLKRYLDPTLADGNWPIKSRSRCTYSNAVPSCVFSW